MSKRSSKPVKRHGHKKNVHAVALGKLGGRVGGPARAKALSDKQRVQIARKGAASRWR